MIAPVHIRPRIGISGKSDDSASVKAMARQVLAAGGEPVLLVNHAQRIAGGLKQGVAKDLSGLSALIVMGNDGDIDPRKYNAAPHPKTNIETDAARAAYEEEALLQAMQCKMPTLGICGGMQRINVLLGGSLHQDLGSIPGMIEHDQRNLLISDGALPVEYIRIDRGTKLKGIAGDIRGVYAPANHMAMPEVLLENSFHHQAVDRLGTGLRASARSSDGVIEAIEPVEGSPMSGQFLLGVQWHPEFGASEIGVKLAGEVVEQAQRYSRRHEQAQQVAATLPLPPRDGGMVDYIMARRQAQGQLTR